MVRLSINLIITEIKELFKGPFFVVYIGMLGVVLGLPFFSDSLYSLIYFDYIVLSFLIPRLPKIFYVLPFGERLIRRYLHLHGILLAMFFIAVGGLITLYSNYQSVPYLEQGWRVLTFYIQICLLMGLIHIKPVKNARILIPFGSTILLLGNFINTLFSSNFKLHISISIGFLICSELLLFFGLKTYKLGNYVEPFFGIFKRQQLIRNGGSKAT